MANMNLPIEERNLTPDQVAALDKRRDFGLALQVISGQFLVIGTFLCLWIGQDLTYSPGGQRPMVYYFLVAALICVVAGLYGTWLRRGSRSF